MSAVITIDVEYGDRPSAEPLRTLDRILEVLDAHAAPATFFVQGRWARAHPELTARLVERDPTLGLHGYNHIDYRRLSEEGLRADLADGVAALQAAAPGHPVRYTRLPHGYGTDLPRVQQALTEHGLVPVGWDFSTFDWDGGLPFDRSAARALGALENGGVVMFHSWPDRTPDLIARFLDAAEGADVVSLADVVLAGDGPQGRTMHVERTDPPR